MALAALRLTRRGGLLEGWVDKKVRALKVNREAMWSAVESAGAVRTLGAYFFLVPLPAVWKAHENAALAVLAERFRVLVTPGSAFGASGYFRVTYGSLGDEECADASERLRNGLAFLESSSPT